MFCGVGIDIGGTRCRAALLSEGGDVVAHASCPTAASSADALVAAIQALVEEVGRSLRSEAKRHVIGIGLPGVVDERGVMRRAVNLECLEGIEIEPFFMAALGRRIVIDSDVNAAAWAQWKRSRRPAARFAYLSIGTGVGAGVVVNGELVRHTHRGPGHWGHVVVDSSPEAPRCRCGAAGCIEAMVCGSAWRDGDSGMERDLKARAVAASCLQLASVYAVDVVALGGGVIDARPDFVDDVRRAVDAMRGSVAPAGLRVERAALPSDEAGAVGAALLAMAHGHRTTGSCAGD